MAIAAAASLPFERVCSSTTHGISSSWMKPPFNDRRALDLPGISFNCRNPLFGSTQFHWLSNGHDLCHSKVSVAADYSDSVPDSSSYLTSQGYHPLEEVKVCKMIRDTKLTSAEIARTTVEANCSATVVFPGRIHCEPHEQISWAEFEYVIDDCGDLYFEIFDDANLLEDRTASNPVNVLFGMDILAYDDARISGDFSILDGSSSDEIPFDDYYSEVVDSEVSDVLDWGLPDTCSSIHPICFAKYLTKAIDNEYNRKMDHPSNGVSILGCLRPAFADEEFYVRRLFNYVDSDGYNSDWKDGKSVSLSSESDRSSTLYRLEIMRIELFSVYGVQSTISLHDFQDAEPDVLVNSTSEIVERFSERGIRCDVALKDLCKRKGLHVEATSEVAAEKQIQQLLFPRSRRKKLSAHNVRGVESY
ncbi:uncharacterized protein At3g49140 isoform X3 [Malus sylvestris]|uniref:uncharacterized protein At3g49140 isoform X3 n=1 Tax=Malus domestica TaxID=3750 RepID=UPI0010AA9745|nr:uncharacterized protein At3g49140 isoform X3 [Malus domestica]XP_050142457.1 uncharacterized protein At3g49140 isoform X3 [Malus sylvestris]